jgi:hypothetical protein
VYPSAKHGANAAWLRLQVLTHNLLQLLKAVVLPQEYAAARPKRLRFAIFTQFGRVVRHAGQVLLRLDSDAWKALIGPAHRSIKAVRWDTAKGHKYLSPSSKQSWFILQKERVCLRIKA